MKIVLPLVLGLAGMGAGVGAAFLSPNSVSDPPEEAAKPEAKQAPEDAQSFEYVRLTNQFVVPIVDANAVVSMVVLSLSLEVRPGVDQQIYALEPKLRDSFIRVLFDHANMGGFGANFTDVEMLNLLRGNLRDVAYRELGDVLNDVLIVDIARQDI